MDRESAKAYVEDMRQRLLDTMSGRRWPVTFSIGVASYARAPADLDGLLAEADGLMYEVKHGGSNRVLQRDLTPHVRTTLSRQFAGTAGVTRKQ